MEDSAGTTPKDRSTQGYNASAVKRAKKSTVVDEIGTYIRLMSWVPPPWFHVLSRFITGPSYAPSRR